MNSILNVDDYSPGRYARTRLLQQAGYLVHEAGTGREALQLVANCQPALILLDVNLPDISGFEVCRQIRRDHQNHGPTVIHISATNTQANQQVEGLDGGADGYLVEPVDPNVLIATVRAFLRARRAEEALRRSNEELERFSYRVAHDLSEPLRSMTVHSQLLQRELGPQLGEKSAQSLSFVIDAAGRMQSFIGGLLSYGLATHVNKSLEPLDCESMLDRATANLAGAIDEAGAKISHDPLPSVKVDPMMEQVFQNLISNAIKYCREGVPPEIHISARRDGKSWLFTVRDNGQGIEPGQEDNLFRLFRRLHGREIPGNGIGLAWSKRIVELHDGTIWVESQPGQGSTFYVRLPIDPPQDEVSSNETHQSEPRP